MIVLGNILIAVATILDSLLSAVVFLILVRCVLSWVNADPYNTVVRIIMQITNPIFAAFSRWRLVIGGIDLTPVVVILAISFIRIALIQSLGEYGAEIKRFGV